MIMLEDGSIVSDKEESSDEDEMPLRDDNEQVESEGEALVNMRALSAQTVEDQEQRSNIFHTRCKVQGKGCMMIIDSGSCTNVASDYLVEKLGLPTFDHPHPYKLQWLNDSGELRVNKQVKVAFTIGKYVDEVLCDVAPMQAGHLLLGRPWEFDRKANHDGLTNKYHFVFNMIPITLVPLSPQEVCKEHVRMKSMIDEWQEKKGDKNKGKSEKKKEKVERGEEKSEKLKKKGSFYASLRDVERVLADNGLVIILLHQDGATNDLPRDLPMEVDILLQEFCDVFPDELPDGIPPLRGIEHQIDLVPGAVIPNKVA